jgi:hypothetical protein
MDEQVTPRNPTEVPPESDLDSRWLSYQQIADIRGIDRESVARMARLRRWRRQKNKLGIVVCTVPVSYLESGHPR